MSESLTILQKLMAVSRLADGVLYVRQAAAARALGTGSQNVRLLALNHRVERFVIAAPKPRARFKEIVFYRTEDLAKAWASPRWRAWGDDEDAYLLEHAGKQTLGEIGKHLGRSANACKCRLRSLGVNSRTNQGMWTAGDIANLAGRSRKSVFRWCRQHGLTPSVWSKGVGHYHLFEPENVRRWFLRTPRVLRTLDERAQRRLGLIETPTPRRAA